MATVIIIPGLSSATKRPGFYGEVKFSAGPLSTASIPLNLLLVGNKTSTGTMTADGAPVQVFSADDVAAYAGPDSELGIMACGVDGQGGALKIPGVNVWLGCVTEGTGTKATTTVTFGGGNASTVGTYYYRVCGVQIPLTITVGTTIAQAATALAAAINALVYLPCTAAAGGAGNAVVTITTTQNGPRQNWFTLFQDTTQGPGTMTSTIAGGTAITGGGVRFSGGAGNDDPANLIAAIAATQFDIIAMACGDATLDATNVAKWKTALNTASGPLVGILEHLVLASTDTLANAANLSKTTLNDARFFVAHHLNGETPAAQTAATLAALICQKVQADPGAGTAFLTSPVPGVAPQTQTADRPTSSVIETALGEGVTELYTGADGGVYISRLITTHCLNGSTPDYRTLDAAQSFVPDYCLKAARDLWIGSVQPNNPRVAPSVPQELKQPPSGVITPDMWAGLLRQLAKSFERGDGLQLPILTDVDNNLPTASWNDAGKYIVSAWPVKVMPGNFICGTSVRQV